MVFKGKPRNCMPANKGESEIVCCDFLLIDIVIRKCLKKIVNYTGFKPVVKILHMLSCHYIGKCAPCV